MDTFIDAFKDHFAVFDKYICHGRNSNLVEFEIPLVESPVGLSTSRISNWTF